MQIEECVEFLRRIGRNLGAQLLEFGAHCFEGGFKTRRFIGELMRRDGVMRYFEPGVGHQVRVADSDSTGHWNAVNGKAHDEFRIEESGFSANLQGEALDVESDSWI